MTPVWIWITAGSKQLLAEVRKNIAAFESEFTGIDTLVHVFQVQAA